MFRKLLPKINYALLGKPSRVVIEPYEDQVALSIFKGKQALSLAQLVGHFPALAPMAQILAPHNEWYVVPLGKLKYVKKFLRKQASRGLQVEISPQIDRLREVERPPNFEVVYFWSQEHGRIERHAWDNARYFGDGWFVIGNRYWQVEGSTEQDDEWLRKEVIEGADIVSFVTTVMDGWYQRQLPYYSALKYSDQPLLWLTIKYCTTDRLVLTTQWQQADAEVQEIPSLPDHVIVSDWIRPGVVPATIPFAELRQNGTHTLTDASIALFVQQVLPRMEHYIEGNVAQLKDLHPGIEDEGHLVLSIEREYYGGIGLASAIPTFVCGALHVVAERVSKYLSSQQPFIRFKAGWLPRTTIEEAGILAGGRAKDGTPLAAITLSPLEIINRGSERLRGAWQEVRFPPFTRHEGDLVLEHAILHLEFLRMWGIPGGLIGNMENEDEALSQFFTHFTHRYRDAKVLVLGFNRSLNQFGRRWNNLVKVRFNGKASDPVFTPFIRGVVLARPRALEAHPEMLKTEWNMLCFLDADRIVKSDKVKSFRLLLNCKKGLTIGLFGSDEFLDRPASRDAISRLFDLPTDAEGQLVWHYSLRNPYKWPPEWPSPYLLRTDAGMLQDEDDEHDQEGEQQQDRSEVSVPARRVTPYKERFIEFAKVNVNRYQKKAKFEPFNGLSPHYEKMSQSQANWYFYWRDQVRKGSYLETDKGYILLHVFELINNIGVKNALDGYLQLRQLWLTYREAYPGLDQLLINWLADYVMLNPCSIDARQIYADEAAFEYTRVHYPNLLIGFHLEKPLSEMPLSLIQELIDYDLSKSKFYNSDHQAILVATIPNVLEQVNEHMIKSNGEGIFERFRPRSSITIKREPFKRALYAGTIEEVTLTTILPYTKREPLNYLLTGIVKHTENKLREKHKFRGRLRNYSVETAVEKIIEQTINPPKQVQKVKIDLTEIERLRRESDQVFELLQVEEEELLASPQVSDQASHQATNQLTEQTGVETTADSPSDLTTQAASDSLITDNPSLDQSTFDGLPEEWAEFAMQLSPYHFEALDAIVTENEASEKLNEMAQAQATMPAMIIDGLNEMALEAIGDIIIEAYPTPHVIEEEYVEALREMVGMVKLSHREGMLRNEL